LADDEFIVIPRYNGMVAFRLTSDKPFGRKNLFQYVVSDFQLEAESPRQIVLEDNYELVGFDLDDQYLYVLF
jgi:hypothetical protein